MNRVGKNHSFIQKLIATVSKGVFYLRDINCFDRINVSRKISVYESILPRWIKVVSFCITPTNFDRLVL